MRFPQEWYGEGRQARFCHTMDVKNNKVYTVRVMLTVVGDRIALSVMTCREWATFSKYNPKSGTEPEWFANTQYSKAYAEWIETGARTYS